MKGGPLVMIAGVIVAAAGLVMTLGDKKAAAPKPKETPKEEPKTPAAKVETGEAASK